MGEEQGWTDAVDGMRVGGRRRVYAKPREGEGPTARCDVEVRPGGRPLFDWLTGTSRLSRSDIEIVWPPDVFLFSTYFFRSGTTSRSSGSRTTRTDRRRTASSARSVAAAPPSGSSSPPRLCRTFCRRSSSRACTRTIGARAHTHSPVMRRRRDCSRKQLRDPYPRPKRGGSDAFAHPPHRAAIES